MYAAVFTIVLTLGGEAPANYPNCPQPIVVQQHSYALEPPLCMYPKNQVGPSMVIFQHHTKGTQTPPIHYHHYQNMPNQLYYHNYHYNQQSHPAHPAHPAPY